jgi:hypothetical protein
VDVEDGEADGAVLRRRVPQANLVPELRAPSPADPNPAPHRDEHVAGLSAWFEPVTPATDPDPMER